MPNKLKPCPFCGCKYIKIIRRLDKYYYATCNCGAEGAMFMTEKNAIEAWNRRRED